MRFVAALLFWLVTTAALAVAVPANWAQHNVVDEAGYVSLARQAATERPLQDAMASVLTNQLVDLGANSGYDISPNLLRGLSAYDVLHVNSEFADQASDHDPSVARVKILGGGGGG